MNNAESWGPATTSRDLNFGHLFYKGNPHASRQGLRGRGQTRVVITRRSPRRRFQVDPGHAPGIFDSAMRPGARPDVFSDPHKEFRSGAPTGKDGSIREPIITFPGKKLSNKARERFDNDAVFTPSGRTWEYHRRPRRRIGPRWGMLATRIGGETRELIGRGHPVRHSGKPGKTGGYFQSLQISAPLPGAKRRLRCTPAVIGRRSAHLPSCHPDASPSLAVVSAAFLLARASWCGAATQVGLQDWHCAVGGYVWPMIGLLSGMGLLAGSDGCIVASP